jgi:3-deoxy-D-manno-octulosonic-acid transferase
MKRYRLLTTLLAPLIGLYLRIRKQRGREDAVRFQERLGFPSLPRPKGKLIWCHAASVGEMMSVISLLKALRIRCPEYSILLTTGTVTSAKLTESRLPEGVFHQYVPVDRWPYVTRFLEYWRPDRALWIESELWPNMLTALKTYNIPTALLNGRMSERSYRRWRLVKNGTKRMLSCFSFGLAQTGQEANRFAALGLPNVKAIGNLKYVADPLPYDEDDLAALQEQTEGRPLWLMASTHEGEDKLAILAHRYLTTYWPNLLTIIVPRHPERAASISALIEEEGLSCAVRSKNEPPTLNTNIYLADTMGELGLFYRLTDLVCLAGSFTWGGHNPIEPAQLYCAVVFGPKMDNFAIMADDMLSHGAARQVESEQELCEALETYLRNPAQRHALSVAAQSWVEEKQTILEETMKILDPFLGQAWK